MWISVSVRRPTHDRRGDPRPRRPSRHCIVMTMMNLAAGAVTAALLLTQEALAFHHQPPAASKRPDTQLFGVGSAVRRARDSLLSRERSREDLKIGIAGFYDRSSKLWEDVWGEHMHHGVSIACVVTNYALRTLNPRTMYHLSD